ncbi:MAG TPA: putative monovalent cation/H+ antiporter subunit A [Candidatus Binatia bacterium]|nr:putative monovalent cation/H+ antiporter subunit A [Candidatus Binatia bacterium]
MSTAILSVFALALAAPWMHRVTGTATGIFLSLLPFSLAVYFARFIPGVSAGETFSINHSWVPSLNTQFSFYLDGLSLLFALLICFIGGLVLIYAGSYLHGHPRLGRFYLSIIFFMGSMLGLVLADNVIALFVFWELTSLSSYLLIGFDHERDAARAGALQALLVTGVGGLALLAGLVLLGQATGNFELSKVLDLGEAVRAHSLYGPILFLILLGAFTKSAQFPFHFWLPNAMEAPTPVSAYLHSATMVKAGVYLLARLSPVLSGTDLWLYTVTGAGTVTMLTGALLALQQTDLKRILAYLTVSALGILVMLLGLGTREASQAVIIFLLGHAFYKGSLFLVAGAIDHETGSRNINHLGGLGRVMPLTATAALLAGWSMAGVIPAFGFIGKEVFYEAVYHSGKAAGLLTGAAVICGTIFTALALVVGVRPFFSEKKQTPKHPHEAPAGLWLGPLSLALLGFIAGPLSRPVGESILAPAIASILKQPVELELSLWHGWNAIVGLSILTTLLGLTLFLGRNSLNTLAQRVGLSSWPGPENAYNFSLDALNFVAGAQTRILQNGYLRYYLLVLIGTTVATVGFPLASQGIIDLSLRWSDIHFYELALAVLILLATLTATLTSSRLGAVAALGVVGYSIGLIYMLFGAPDLAMTQFLVETLMVILFVLVFYFLPRFAVLSPTRARVRDGVVALLAGGMMTIFVMIATSVQFHPSISDYFAEQSVPLAHGRNIVNVILVDFRALDTLGEITVLGVAGIGVYALLKLKLGKEKGS